MQVFNEKGIFFIKSNGKKIQVNQHQAEKLADGCTFEVTDGELKIIETEEYLEKNKNYEISRLKQKTNQEILEKYPYYMQINMSAEIQEIHLNARNEDRLFTDSELEMVGKAKEMKDWIDSKREECNQKINNL